MIVLKLCLLIVISVIVLISAATTQKSQLKEQRSNEPNDFLVNHPDYNYHNHDHNHDFQHHHHHYHHDHNDDDIIARKYDNQSVCCDNSSIPLDFARTISEYGVNDLLLNVIDDAPQDFISRPPILQTRFGDVQTNNETERNSAEIARPAKCMPELTTVRTTESSDPYTFLIPECTRIERCGGCCAHVLLSCQPIETETVTLSVMKTEYTGNKKLKYVGKELILLEKHTKCKCKCKIQPEDCSAYQEYRESECRCVCKNLDEEKKCHRKGGKKLWNPDACACQCREIMPCSTNYHFDFNECRCIESQVKRRYIIDDNQNEGLKEA